MFRFMTSDLLRWFHMVLMALGGGGTIIALLLLGLEEDQESFRGLAAALWKRVVVWAFRLAILVGIVLIAFQLAHHERPFAAIYLHIKLVLVAILAVVVETGAKSLAQGKRGAALLATLLFLLITFVVANKRAFGGPVPKDVPYSNPATPTLQAH